MNLNINTDTFDSMIQYNSDGNIEQQFTSHAKIQSDVLSQMVLTGMRRHAQRIAQLVQFNNKEFDERLRDVVIKLCNHYGLDTSTTLNVYANVSKGSRGLLIQTYMTRHVNNASNKDSRDVLDTPKGCTEMLPRGLVYRKAPSPEIVLMSMNQLEEELQGWY